MTNELIGILITSFVGGGLATHIFNWFTSRKQAKVNVDVTISDAWKSYAGKMETRLSEMETKYTKLQAEYFELKRKYHHLEQQISNG